jgi:ADP-ribosylglycohydrolase
MSESITQTREDQFLGAMLGFAIGDALGRPVVGMTAAGIRERHGSVRAYIHTDEVDAEIPGEITGITEIALCIVESVTTNGGMIEPENINARLSYLVNGPAREWMSEATISGIAHAAERNGLVDEAESSTPEFAVALRGVPVGLLHAVGGYDPGALERDSGLVSRLTHGGREQANLVRLVAESVNWSARRREHIRPSRIDGVDQVSTTIRDVLEAIEPTHTFGMPCLPRLASAAAHT